MDWHAFAKRLLLGRTDHVSPAAAAVARAAVFADGKISEPELQFLLEIRREAKVVSGEFSSLVADILEQAVLRDGRIDRKEVDWLRTVFLAGRPPAGDDIQLLRRLEEKAGRVCDEFLHMMREFEGQGRTDVHRG